MGPLSPRTRASKSVEDRAATAAVYLLADHLDAVLAAGEDLRTLALDVPKRSERQTALMIAERLAAEHAFVARVRELELIIISRVLQARARAAEVVRADVRFKAIVGLFSGGTHPLVDAVTDLGPAAQAQAQFHGRDDALGFFRSRALIAPETANLDIVDRITVGDRFLLATRIELGALLDLVATFLTTLETHYDLFDAADDAAARAGATSAAA